MSTVRPFARSGLLLLPAAVLLASSCATHARPVGAPEPPSRAVLQLRSDLSRVFGAPILQHALFGVAVRSVESGELLYELNAGKLMMPASNMKILTTAVAADRLGWEYRFETRLVSRAPIENGVLRGDLVVVGSGDPSINARDGLADKAFDDLARQLREAGITSIEGGIVGDDNAFDDEGLGGGWSWDYLVYGYAAPVGPLLYNECLARIVVHPGVAAGAAATVVAPEASGFIPISRVVTGEPGSRPQVDFRRLPGSSVLEVTGQVPAGGEPVSRTVSVDNPTLYFVRALREALAARGIPVGGVAVDVDDLVPGLPPEGGSPNPDPGAVGARLPSWRDASTAPRSEDRVLATWTSPPLSAIGSVLMKVSQNLYAEALLKTLGREHGVGTAENGRRVVRDVLEGWGVTPDQHRQYDGSGLSRYNYVTPGGIVAILRHMALDERLRDGWMAALPVAGGDGTLANRMRRPRVAGNVRAKTGSIANVRSLSGYVTTRDGELIAFSIIGNHFLLPSATIDYATEIAVEYLANFTRQ